MGAEFKHRSINWVEYRRLPNVLEVDFHWSGEEYSGNYYENMELVRQRALKAIQQAQEEGRQFVLFTHGHSTSRNGSITARSQVRGLMRSKDATPFILRSECIQQSSVFVAAIRPKPKLG